MTLEETKTSQGDGQRRTRQELIATVESLTLDEKRRLLTFLRFLEATERSGGAPGTGESGSL